MENENKIIGWYSLPGGRHLPIYAESSSEEFLNKRGLKIAKKTIDNLDGKITNCKAVSDAITLELNKLGYKAETVNVSVVKDDEYISINGHYVTKLDNKLYDYTTNQFRNSQTIKLETFTYRRNGIYSDGSDIKLIDTAKHNPLSGLNDNYLKKVQKYDR